MFFRHGRYAAPTPRSFGGIDGNAVVTGSVDAVNNNRFAVDADLAFLRDIDAAQHLDQRGFARTVLTQQRVDLAGFQLKLHILQCLDARKGFGYSLHFEQVFAHKVSPPLCLGCSEGKTRIHPEKGFAQMEQSPSFIAGSSPSEKRLTQRIGFTGLLPSAVVVFSDYCR
jgi:hypothetical protein